MLTYQPHSMLVTGGAGFIGANFIRYILTNEPHIRIINLDKLTYAASLDNLKNLPHPELYHFVQADINDGKLVTALLEQFQIDTIVHFAAESHVDRSIASPAPFVETNIHGTYILLEAALQYWLQKEKKNSTECRFHHISTDEVYGSLTLHSPAFTEKTAYQPRSPYSASKAAADHLVNAYYHTYGLPITLSNSSNNYGPYQHAEKLIPTIIRHCLHQKPIPIYGDGKNIRDWLYVDDHCQAIMAIIKHGKVGENYNIGGNNEWENMALARYICEQMDLLLPQKKSHTTLLEYVTDRRGHDFRYAIDNTKIKNEIRWQPQEIFASGIKKTIHFYRTS